MYVNACVWGATEARGIHPMELKLQATELLHVVLGTRLRASSREYMLFGTIFEDFIYVV